MQVKNMPAPGFCFAKGEVVRRQGYFPGPGAVRLQPAAARPVDPSPKGGGFRAVSAPAAIRKAAVMACHGEGGEGLARAPIHSKAPAVA